MIHFGTGGWRGIIAEDFNFENVRVFSQVIADEVNLNRGKDLGVVIGYDNRFMSEDFAKASAEVFAGNGIIVYIFDTSVPTPMVNFALKKLHGSCSLTFTASHNPAVYNGIKYTLKGGMPAQIEVTERLESKMNSFDAKKVKKISYGEAVKNNMIKIFNCQDEYISFIENQIDMESIRKKRLKVLYDPMYGTGITSVGTLLVDLRCNLEIIHNQRNPLFGGRVPAPNEETLWRIRYMVKEKGFDAAFATDGDADRLAIVDDESHYLHPNMILALLYNYLLEDKGLKGGVVRNLCTTHMVDRIAKAHGENVYETPVGFKYIADSLVKTDAIIGGESSGGIAVRGHLLEKDGILATGMVLEMMAKKGEKLSTLVRNLENKYGKLYFLEKNFTFNQLEKEAIKDAVKNLKSEDFGSEIVSSSNLDGIKFKFRNDTWISIRFSGTEPVIRFMAEGESDEVVSEIFNSAVKSISKKFKLDGVM